MKKLVCGHCGKEFATINEAVYDVERHTDQVLNIYDESTGKVLVNVIVYDEEFHCTECSRNEFLQCEDCGCVLYKYDADFTVYDDEHSQRHILCRPCYEEKFGEEIY